MDEESVPFLFFVCGLVCVSPVEPSEKAWKVLGVCGCRAGSSRCFTVSDVYCGDLQVLYRFEVLKGMFLTQK